jgi:hypothetical protein
VDLLHFGTDPDPRIRTYPAFLSVADKQPTKKNFFGQFGLRQLKIVRLCGSVPDPAESVFNWLPDPDP